MRIKRDSVSNSLIPVSELAVSSALLVNTLTWFYLMRMVVDSFVQSQGDVVFFGALYFTIILSGVIGTLLARNTKRAYILYVWLIMGVIVSLASALSAATTAPNAALLAFFFGFAFGFGAPSNLSYFADCLTFENRGRNGGLLFAIVNLGSFVFLIGLGDNAVTASVVASLWRMLGFVILLLSRPHKTEVPRGRVAFSSVRDNKPFILFFIGWLMFLLVDSVGAPYTTALASQFAGGNFAAFDSVFEPLIGTIFAIVAGIAADYVGRKRVILSGFIALGAAFALLSVAPYVRLFWYIAITVHGIAWGMFYVIFVLVLWGDLSPEKAQSEIYFMLGGIPLFFADFISGVVSPYVQNVSKDTVYAAFPLASFFLFLAVFPLMYAPETLPEKKIRDREIKSYLDQAKKAKEKYPQK